MPLFFIFYVFDSFVCRILRTVRQWIWTVQMNGNQVAWKRELMQSNETKHLSVMKYIEYDFIVSLRLIISIVLKKYLPFVDPF